MQSLRVKGKNVGPIPVVDFALPGHGVTVISAPNGSGKSILLDALQSMLSGTGKVPIRDGETKGELSAFGASLSIGKQTRRGGVLDVLSLEGGFDLAKLVDPGIKDDVAADKHRIKQMVLLAGQDVTLEPFSALPDFGDVVTFTDDAAADMVDAADKVKRAYEAAARESEAEVLKEYAAIQACQTAIDGVDLKAECDEAVLRLAYDTARDRLLTLRHSADAYRDSEAARNEAQATLDRLQSEYGGLTVDAAEEAMVRANEARIVANEKVSRIKEELAAAEDASRNAEHVFAVAGRDKADAKRHVEAVTACKSILETVSSKPVSEDEMRVACDTMNTAQAAMERGVKVRFAKQKSAEVAEHQTAAESAKRAAEVLRTAAASVDGVLSSTLQFTELAITDGRLTVPGHKRGKATMFGDLSHGERYKLAVSIASEHVGTDGLILLSQEGWESLDVYARDELHKHATDLSVYILTLEATRTRDDGPNMVVKHYQESEADE